MNDVGTGSTGYPFRQTMEYDAFSNLTERWTKTYNLTDRSFEATYANNRKTPTSGGTSDTYDAAGNVIDANDPGVDHKQWQFDAAGRSWRWEEHGPWGATTTKGEETQFDGDGRPVKRTELEINYGDPDWIRKNWYYIYSSVTGQKITDLIFDGNHGWTHIYMGSTIIAEKTSTDLTFKVNDPITGSMRKITSAGVVWGDLDEGGPRTEIAGMHTAVPPTDPQGTMPPPLYNDAGWAGGPENGCAIDGDPMPCTLAKLLAEYDDKHRPLWPRKPGEYPPPKPIGGYNPGPFPDDYVFADNVNHKKNRKGLRLTDKYNDYGDRIGSEWRVEPDGYPGGSPNPLAQLAPCPELSVLSFDELSTRNSAALTLLQNTNGEGSRSAYDNMTTYEKAVFLNTAAGASTAGVNFSDSQLVGFYRSDKPGNLPFGIIVTFASGTLSGRHKDDASLEIHTKNSISTMDLDLYNPLASVSYFFKHRGEDRFNDRHKRPTHPGDVAKQLAKRDVDSGVSCKR